MSPCRISHETGICSRSTLEQAPLDSFEQVSFSVILKCLPFSSQGECEWVLDSNGWLQ